MAPCKHIAVRLSQPSTARGGGQSIIDAHNDLVRRHGECAFGKFGAPISFGTKSLIDAQIGKGQETFLYVILRDGDKVSAFRAKIRSVAQKISKETEGQFVFPTYYSERPASAIIIGEEFRETSISHLVVSSSNRPLLDAVLSSRTPLMLVNLVGDRVSGGECNV